MPPVDGLDAAAQNVSFRAPGGHGVVAVPVAAVGAAEPGRPGRVPGARRLPRRAGPVARGGPLRRLGRRLLGGAGAEVRRRRRRPRRRPAARRRRGRPRPPGLDHGDAVAAPDPPRPGRRRLPPGPGRPERPRRPRHHPAHGLLLAHAGLARRQRRLHLLVLRPLQLQAAAAPRLPPRRPALARRPELYRGPRHDQRRSDDRPRRLRRPRMGPLSKLRGRLADAHLGRRHPAAGHPRRPARGLAPRLRRRRPRPPRLRAPERLLARQRRSSASAGSGHPSSVLGRDCELGLASSFPFVLSLAFLLDP